MSNEILQAVGTSFANIAGAIAECVRHDAQGSAPPVEFFEQCLNTEIQRVQALGEDGLAVVIGTLQHPISRLLREGW